MTNIIKTTTNYSLKLYLRTIRIMLDIWWECFFLTVKQRNYMSFLLGCGTNKPTLHLMTPSMEFMCARRPKCEHRYVAWNFSRTCTRLRPVKLVRTPDAPHRCWSFTVGAKTETIHLKSRQRPYEFQRRTCCIITT